MSTQVGRQLEIGVAVEGVRGTGEAAPAKWIKHVSADIIPRTEKVVDDNVRGVLEDSEGARVVREWFEGELAGILHADMLGYMLLSVYGSVVTTPGSGAYTHMFSVLQDVQHPTLTFFRKDGEVESQAYSGGVISALEISASTEDYVRFSATALASGAAPHTEDATYNTEYDFIGKDITVKVANTEGGLAAAPLIKAKTLTVRFDPGVIADYVLGSNNPDDHYTGKMAIEVEFSKNYDSTDFEDLFKSGAYRYVQIAVEGDATIGSTNPGFTLILNKAQVQEWERSGAQDELVEETIKLKAFYNAADGEQSTLALTNLTAAYEAADES